MIGAKYCSCSLYYRCATVQHWKNVKSHRFDIFIDIMSNPTDLKFLYSVVIFEVSTLTKSSNSQICNLS